MRLPVVLATSALLATPAVALAGVAKGPYKGRTDQNRAVTFKVSGGKVRDFQAGVMTFCTTSGNTRFETDAIAGLPAIPIRANGMFRLQRDLERDGTITVEVKGRITGSKAKGTVSLSRPDSSYDASEGRVVFGACSAHDRAFTAKRR